MLLLLTLLANKTYTYTPLCKGNHVTHTKQHKSFYQDKLTANWLAL